MVAEEGEGTDRRSWAGLEVVDQHPGLRDLGTVWDAAVQPNAVGKTALDTFLGPWAAGDNDCQETGVEETPVHIPKLEVGQNFRQAHSEAGVVGVYSIRSIVSQVVNDLFHTA